ncbi:MAG: phage holin family protein [Chloroflexota bacterium]
MARFLLHLIVTAATVLALQGLAPGLIQVNGFGAALVFALVLGLLNALVRPVLLLITCPFTVITLGLFVFVVNALVFWIGTWALPGISVSGFVGALVGSLAVSLTNGVANRVFDRVWES